jgi:hypothetical protein
VIDWGSACVTWRLADLPHRIERLLANLTANPAAAAPELEALVAETVALIEQHMPDVDVTEAKRFLGERHVAWRLPSRP